MKPVVLEFVFMRTPFSELATRELVKDMFVTLLSELLLVHICYYSEAGREEGLGELS
jgi:hypothetical protein